MRIATYNIHSSIGVDGRCAPERIAAVIAEMDPDVVCLQEVDVVRDRTGRIDQAAEIARILEMTFHFNATIEQVTGRYGDAILCKTPFELVAARALPEVPRPFPRESRGAIWIATTVAGHAWQIINTHFGLGHGERRLQARRLAAEWITPALPLGPVIVCGDLNSRPASAIHTILSAALRDVFRTLGRGHPRTFPTRWPLLCLDYFYASPGVQVRQAERWASPLARIASDHFPLVAEIEAA